MKKSSQGYRLVFGYLGSFLMMIGLIILLPLAIIIFYPNEIEYSKYFMIPGIVIFILGFLLSLLNYKRELQRLKRHEDMLILVLVWLSAVLLSAFPLFLTKDYTYTQSVFEMTSGYTTTGMSLFKIEGAPHIFLFYRSITHYIGGVGLVLVLTSTVSDKFGIQLFAAEGHTDRLLPNLVKSARFIFSIYTIYILLGSLFYMNFGMNAFDALNHAISAVSTGGFSTKAESIAYYNSVPIEIITIVLMLLGSTNFMVHLFLFRRQFKKVVSHIELKFLLVYGIFMISLLSLSSGFNTFNESFRIGSFQFVSAMSSTGLVNHKSAFLTFSPLFLLLVTTIMAIGGGAGSTAGGAKLYRTALFSKSLYWEIKDKFKHPNLINIHQINYLGKKEVVTEKEVNENYTFLGIYFFILIIGAAIITSFNYSLGNALFEASSLLGNSGLSMGILNNLDAPNLLYWLGILLMLLGRLEIYVIFFSLTKISSDSKKLILSLKKKEL